jgi:prepilin-type N-terminal cleavage/methylation domain-containing protein
MMYSQKNNQSGFSLVETLVAITILLIVITGPLTLVSNSARSTNFANDQVMANFLAQEGLELVQSVRDDLLIPKFAIPSPGGNAWDDFSNTDPAGPLDECLDGGCGLEQETDPTGEIKVSDCPVTDVSACRLYLNAAANQRAAYTHDNGGGNIESRYTRVITMDDAIPGQVKVVSTVTWRSDGQRAEQSVQTVTYLFDVYGR